MMRRTSQIDRSLTVREGESKYAFYSREAASLFFQNNAYFSQTIPTSPRYPPSALDKKWTPGEAEATWSHLTSLPTKLSSIGFRVPDDSIVSLQLLQTIDSLAQKNLSNENDQPSTVLLDRLLVPEGALPEEKLKIMERLRTKMSKVDGCRFSELSKEERDVYWEYSFNFLLVWAMSENNVKEELVNVLKEKFSLTTCLVLFSLNFPHPGFKLDDKDKSKEKDVLEHIQKVRKAIKNFYIQNTFKEEWFALLDKSQGIEQSVRHTMLLLHAIIASLKRLCRTPDMILFSRLADTQKNIDRLRGTELQKYNDSVRKGLEGSKDLNNNRAFQHQVFRAPFAGEGNKKELLMQHLVPGLEERLDRQDQKKEETRVNAYTALQEEAEEEERLIVEAKQRALARAQREENERFCIDVRNCNEAENAARQVENNTTSGSSISPVYIKCCMDDDDPNWRQVPAARSIAVRKPFSPLNDRVESIPCSIHVARWVTASKEEIKGFKDVAQVSGETRYAQMTDLQLQEQRLRHFSPVNELLGNSNSLFVQKYLRTDDQQFFTGFALLKTSPNIIAETPKLVTLKIEHGKLVHFFIADSEGLGQTGTLLRSAIANPTLGSNNEVSIASGSINYLYVENGQAVNPLTIQYSVQNLFPDEQPIKCEITFFPNL